MSVGDEEKAGLLRRLVPGAADRLLLFDADLFDAATFAPAIAGCQFVFLLATPFGLEAAGSKVQCRMPIRSLPLIRRALNQILTLYLSEKRKLTFQRNNWTWPTKSEK